MKTVFKYSLALVFSFSSLAFATAGDLSNESLDEAWGGDYHFDDVSDSGSNKSHKKDKHHHDHI